MLLEESMDFFEIAVAEVAFAQEVEGGNVVVGKGDQFIGEEYGVGVVVDVEVVDRQFVEPFEDVVAEQLREGVQFGKVVLGVLPVVGLQELGQEEHAVGFCGCEDGGFGAMHGIQIDFERFERLIIIG